MKEPQNSPNDIQGKVLDLTDAEWMSIVARDRGGLPPCCGNISTLRDMLISVARDNGHIDFLTATPLWQALHWCFPDHEVPSDVIEKILTQLDWKIEDDIEHPRQTHE